MIELTNLAFEAEQRILIFDGAMATMIQRMKLTETDFRDVAFANHHIELKGNNDLLNLTRPEFIQDIHIQYLVAGADIISTNTFGANRISQADYCLENQVVNINYEGARLARAAVSAYQATHPSRPLFVAGAIGPTTKLASMSPLVNDPSFRAVTFDQLVEAYTEQAKALINGGVDLFLLETITDTLNAKAALFSLMSIFNDTGKHFPIMVSGTITDASGRILSGQTIEAFLVSISHAPIFSIGLNCALGAEELRPYLEVLSEKSQFRVSVHPNAGLPNQFGDYDQSASEFSELMAEFAGNGWLNIVGGCCGTTPQHIAAVAKQVKRFQPRKIGLDKQPQPNQKSKEEVVLCIDQWEGSNVPGSPTFLLKELISIIANVEDECTFTKMRQKFLSEKDLYHPEQAMLLNAHIFGRYQCLRAENRISVTN